MNVEQTIEELKEFYRIQEMNQNLQQNIQGLYELINEYSGKATLQEVLEQTLQMLNENGKRYSELYHRYVERNDYLEPENPLYIFRNLNAAVSALMKESGLSYEDLEKEIPYSAVKLKSLIQEKEFHEDSHAVYCVLCDYFGLDKEQYIQFTKIETLSVVSSR